MNARIPRSLVWFLVAIPPLLFLEQFIRHYAGQGWDFVPVWNAARNFLHHQPLYFQGRPGDAPAWADVYYLFVYPPSLLVLIWPLGLLSFVTSNLVFTVADAAAILLAAGLCLRLFSIRMRSRTGLAVAGLLFLALPVTDTLHSGNVNGLVLAAEAAMFLAAAQRQWLLAGVFLGLSLLVKPILLPLIVVFLLARNWRPALLALGIPVLLSLAVLPFTADGGQFFSRAVPFLINGNAAEFQRFSISVAGQATIVGLPSIVTILFRAVLVGAGSLLVWIRWNRRGDDRLRLVEVGGLIVLVTILSFSFAWQYHVLFLLPWVLSAWQPASLFRHPLAWVAVYLAAGPDIYLMERSGGVLFHLGVGRITLGLVLLFAVAGASLMQQRKPTLAIQADVISVARSATA
jgi:arabinofuranan 3-O-arabinosyltransferase